MHDFQYLYIKPKGKSLPRIAGATCVGHDLGLSQMDLLDQLRLAWPDYR